MDLRPQLEELRAITDRLIERQKVEDASLEAQKSQLNKLEVKLNQELDTLK